MALTTRIMMKKKKESISLRLGLFFSSLAATAIFPTSAFVSTIFSFNPGIHPLTHVFLV
jgi:hypothetical protein